MHVSQKYNKTLSEALILASTNPQYADRLFIELQVQYMKIPSWNMGIKNMLCIEIVSDILNNFCTQHVLPRFELGIFMYVFVIQWTNTYNLSSYCGLVDAKIRASDKDLPVSYEAKNFYFCPSLLGQKFFVSCYGRIEKKFFQN